MPSVSHHETSIGMVVQPDETSTTLEMIGMAEQAGADTVWLTAGRLRPDALTIMAAASQDHPPGEDGDRRRPHLATPPFGRRPADKGLGIPGAGSDPTGPGTEHFGGDVPIRSKLPPSPSATSGNT